MPQRQGSTDDVLSWAVDALAKARGVEPDSINDDTPLTDRELDIVGAAAIEEYDLSFGTFVFDGTFTLGEVVRQIQGEYQGLSED